MLRDEHTLSEVHETDVAASWWAHDEQERSLRMLFEKMQENMCETYSRRA
jgi:hypothetical protein